MKEITLKKSLLRKFSRCSSKFGGLRANAWDDWAAHARRLCKHERSVRDAWSQQENAPPKSLTGVLIPDFSWKHWPNLVQLVLLPLVLILLPIALTALIAFTLITLSTLLLLVALLFALLLLLLFFPGGMLPTLAEGRFWVASGRFQRS